MSFAPEHRLILATHTGPRTKASADAIVKSTGERLDEEHLPLFVSDGLKLYSTALLDRYHYIHVFPRTGNRGRPRKPVKCPLPELRYAQVVKNRQGSRVVSVDKRIVFGMKKEIPESDICTSLIERQNLSLRQENHRLARKTLGFSKEDIWLSYQTVLHMAHHNFVRTHLSLKKPIKIHVRGNVWKKYRSQTPMMSIGITDHVWTLDELLRFPYHKTSTN